MRAFVPSHITGFFAAKRDDDPMKAGSIGCGLTLDLGATTTVEKSDKTEIFLNGHLSEAPVSRYVVDRLARSPVRVETQLDMPLGSGFGASGGGALGCAYALNSIFDLGLLANQAAAVAHAAEVVNRTGLGDVIAQNTGGLVVRLEPGAPGIGKVDRIPVPPLRIDYVVRGPNLYQGSAIRSCGNEGDQQGGRGCCQRAITKAHVEAVHEALEPVHKADWSRKPLGSGRHRGRRGRRGNGQHDNAWRRRLFYWRS